MSTIFDPDELDCDFYRHITVKLTGENGNTLNLLGIVNETLRQHGVPRATRDRLARAIVACTSYEAALQTLQRWVTVV